MTPETIIRLAAKADQFLKDEVFTGALLRLERKYFEEFKQTKTSEERIRAWAKAAVLDDFKEQLRIVIDAGEREVLTADAEARRTAKATPRT
jgi:hypothetical protein